MELSQLRYFIVVAELGNMSKAAEVLFVSQPNLSTSISRLEEEVGAPLFERRRGKITLNRVIEFSKHMVFPDIATAGVCPPVLCISRAYRPILFRKIHYKIPHFPQNFPLLFAPIDI